MFFFSPSVLWPCCSIKWPFLIHGKLTDRQGVFESGWWPHILMLAHVQPAPVKTNTSLPARFAPFIKKPPPSFSLHPAGLCERLQCSGHRRLCSDLERYLSQSSNLSSVSSPPRLSHTLFCCLFTDLVPHLEDQPLGPAEKIPTSSCGYLLKDRIKHHRCGFSNTSQHQAKPWYSDLLVHCGLNLPLSKSQVI